MVIETHRLAYGTRLDVCMQISYKQPLLLLYCSPVRDCMDGN